MRELLLVDVNVGKGIEKVDNAIKTVLKGKKLKVPILYREYKYDMKDSLWDNDPFIDEEESEIF